MKNNVQSIEQEIKNQISNMPAGITGVDAENKIFDHLADKLIDLCKHELTETGEKKELKVAMINMLRVGRGFFPLYERYKFDKVFEKISDKSIITKVPLSLNRTTIAPKCIIKEGVLKDILEDNWGKDINGRISNGILVVEGYW